jgi:ubiquinone/menaquinone biosynthesis C-methylase UbiE
VTAVLATTAQGRLRWTAALTGTAALAALIPAGLGLDYVLAGKLALRDRVMDAVGWRGDEVVLDVGSGAGLLAVAAAHRVPRGRVVAVDLWVAKDLSSNSADRLRRNAELDGVLDRVEIRTGDARALDLPADSVDVVVSSLCLHNIADTVGRRAAVTEIARVLRPAGTVVVADLAGTHDIAQWLTEAGLIVRHHDRVPRTFPPQRLLVADAGP